MNNSTLVFRVHAVQRMFERRISVRNVSQVIESGEMIEDYSAEMPEPSRLLLGFQGKRPFHVVMAESPEEAVTIVITVYQPDASTWHKNFKRRRS